RQQSWLLSPPRAGQLKSSRRRKLPLTPTSTAPIRCDEVYALRTATGGVCAPDRPRTATFPVSLVVSLPRLSPRQGRRPQRAPRKRGSLAPPYRRCHIATA